MANRGAAAGSARIAVAPTAADLRYKIAVHAQRSPSSRRLPGPRPSRFRWAWWLLAYASLGLGLVGVFLPGLPTVPFVLLSAFAAARGSERLHRRLLAHRQFGPMIRDWQAHGAVSRRAKWLATVMMALCAVIMFLTAPKWWMAGIGTATMTVVALWLWWRPEPPR